MTKAITKSLGDEEWYQSLIEECQAIIVEKIWASREEIMRCWWLVGESVDNKEGNFKKSGFESKRDIIQKIARDLGKSDRTIYYAWEFYSKCPEKENFEVALQSFIVKKKIEEGKNLSWYKIMDKYLSEPRDEKQIPLPKGKYQVIYADPPWSYKDQGCQGTMANHYRGMKIEEICNLPIQNLIAENSILFLWATYPMLKEALQVIEAWGFEYKTIAFQWIKLNKSGKGYFYGLGRWTRGNTEPCLLATKGKIERKSESVFQIVEAPLTKHSEKPEIVKDKIIELVGELPRIELFARKKTKGWEVWGDQL